MYPYRELSMKKSILHYMQEAITTSSRGSSGRVYNAADRRPSATGKPQKKNQPTPKLMGGWKSYLDPGAMHTQIVDKAEAQIGQGEEGIDETDPRSILKGLNRGEQLRRARKLGALVVTGGVPMGESNKPNPGTNRWWKWLGEQTKRKPKKTRLYSEEISRVIFNRLHKEK